MATGSIRERLLHPLVLIAAGIIAYANSFRGVFVFDDRGWLLKNINHPQLLDHLLHSTRPLTALTFYINYHLSGRNVADYHLVNLIIHISAGLLLYGIIRRTIALANSGNRHIIDMLPVYAALVWLVHPLQTESVTYIVQRAESLMGMLYLATLYLAIRGMDAPRPTRWHIFAIFASCLGMLAKPVMITAPVMVLLYDRTFVAGSFKQAFNYRRLLYCGLFASTLLAIALILLPNESTSSTGASVAAAGPLRYLATQTGVILHYLRLIIWPRHLCLDYAWPPLENGPRLYFSALVMGTLLALTIYLAWRKTVAGFCLAWFFITLLPTSSFIPVDDFAVEHRLYLALAAPAILFCLAVIRIIPSIIPAGIRPRTTDIIVASLPAICVATLTAHTISRNRVYFSTAGMFRNIAAQRPDNFRARTYVIDDLIDKAEYNQAERMCRKLIDEMLVAEKSGKVRYKIAASDPTRHLAVAYSQLGQIYLSTSRPADAIQLLQQSLLLNPRKFTTPYLLALAYNATGDTPSALRYANLAIKIKPDAASGYTLAGIILQDARHYTRARNSFEKAIQLNRGDIVAKLNLAMLLATNPQAAIRNGKRARRYVEDVIRLTAGGNYRTLDTLAASYAAEGNFDKAIALEAEALRQAVADKQQENSPNRQDNPLRSTPRNIQARIQSYQRHTIWLHPAEKPE